MILGLELNSRILIDHAISKRAEEEVKKSPLLVALGERKRLRLSCSTANPRAQLENDSPLGEIEGPGIRPALIVGAVAVVVMQMGLDERQLSATE